MRKLLLVILAVILVGGSILSSCGEPTETTTTEPTTAAEAEMVTLELEKLDGTLVEKEVEKPRYGGTLTYPIPSGDNLFTVFGEVHNGMGTDGLGVYTNERLLTGDFYRSAAGTGEFSFAYTDFWPLEQMTGCLAESYEMPDSETLIFHIRPGIYWTDKPPVNGREVTADDIVYYHEWAYANYRHALYLMTPEDSWPTSITATDEYTVEFKSSSAYVLLEYLQRYSRIWPREFLDEVTQETKWEDNIGTGPFIVTEFVPDSSATLERNPNYWGTDPLFPENQLPYIDKLQITVLPDISTRMAALRTGEVDAWDPRDCTITLDLKEELLSYNPDLEYIGIPQCNVPIISMRTDLEPFSDIRVRKALAMAINREEIRDELYKGDAVIYSWPVNANPDCAAAFTLFEDLPAETQEQFVYNPEGARALLDEALGEGVEFDSSIVLQDRNVDVMSLIIEDWADIGVNVTLDVRETGAWQSLRSAGTYDQMILAVHPSHKVSKVLYVAAGSPVGGSKVDDPWSVQRYSELKALLPDYATFCAIMKEEIVPYILEHVWFIQVPTPDIYQFWQPWVKQYNGEVGIGLQEWRNFPIYAWIDEDLKAEMGY